MSRGINYREDPQIVLPLTHFETKFDVDDRTNEAHDALKNSGLGSANLYPLGVCPRIRSWRRKPPRNNLLTVIWTLSWSN